jgi:O-antigen/teichoic acid export membrane protein
MMQSNTSKNIFWSILDKFGNYAMNFIVGIILARLLGPQAFGIIGYVLIFVGVANVMATAGLRDAIIRKKSPTNNDYATLQLVNICLSVLLYIVIYLSAPLIAHFFDEALLNPIIRVYFLIIIIQSFAFTKHIQLIKQLDFRGITIISVIATTIAGITAIIMAFSGFGVWSLVALGLVNWTLRTILFFLYSPGFNAGFSRSSFNELWSFGSKMLASELMNEFFNNLNRAFVGKVFSTTTLGLFTKSETYKDTFSKNVSFAFISVYFPVLSDIQDDVKKLKESYRGMMSQLTFFIFMAMFILMGCSQNFIVNVLGEQWEDAVTILRILCVSGLLKPIISLNTNLLKVLGRSDIILKNQIIYNSLTCLNLVFAYVYGVYALIIGIGIYSAAMALITSRYGKSLIDYSFAQQLKDMKYNFIIGIITFILLFAIDINLETSWSTLGIQIITVGLILISTGVAFPQSEPGRYTSLLLGQFKKRK